MTAAEQAKLAGLPGLQTIADMTGKSRGTLGNWYRDNPELFAIVLAGCRVKQDQRKAVQRVAAELWRRRSGPKGAPFCDLSPGSREVFIGVAEQLVAIARG